MGVATVARYERGQSITLEFLEAYCDVLSIPAVAVLFPGLYASNQEAAV